MLSLSKPSSYVSLALVCLGCTPGDSSPTTGATSAATTVESTSPTTDPTTTMTVDPSETTEPTIGPTTETTETSETSETSETTDSGEPPVCGNGIPEDGEQCDDGNDNEQDGCEADCTLTPGAPYWTRLVDVDNQMDAARGVAIDDAANIYVVGTVTTQLAGTDIWIRKYDPTGVSLWTQQYDGGIGQDDQGNAITTDGFGFMTAVGRQTTGQGQSEYWLSRCDPQGQLLWAFTDNAPISGSAIAQAPDGDVVVAGSIAQGDTNAWVTRYDSGGSSVWTRVYEGPDGGLDSASGVAVDTAGNVIIVGRTFTDSESFNVFIQKHAPDGVPLWSATHDGPVSGIDWANAVAVDPADDNIVVAGREAQGDAAKTDAWLARYDPDGNLIWDTVHTGAAGETDLANGVAIDASGHIVVVGSEDMETNQDIWLAKYDAEGTQIWLEYHDGEMGLDDVGAAVATDSNNDIVAVGEQTIVNNFNSDIWIFKREP